MVTLEGFIDKVVNVALLVHIALAAVLVQNIIEIEIFGLASIVDLDFFPLIVDLDGRVEVTVFCLSFEKWADANCGFNLTVHLIKLFGSQL